MKKFIFTAVLAFLLAINVSGVGRVSGQYRNSQYSDRL